MYIFFIRSIQNVSRTAPPYSYIGPIPHTLLKISPRSSMGPFKETPRANPPCYSIRPIHKNRKQKKGYREKIPPVIPLGQFNKHRQQNVHVFPVCHFHRLKIQAIYLNGTIH